MCLAPPFCNTEMYSTGDENNLVCIFIVVALWTTLPPILPVRGENTRAPGERVVPPWKGAINQPEENETSNAWLEQVSDARSAHLSDLATTRGSVQPFWSAARPGGDSTVTSVCNGSCVCTRSAGGGLKVECTKPGTLLTLPDLGPENANVTEL